MGEIAFVASRLTQRPLSKKPAFRRRDGGRRYWRATGEVFSASQALKLGLIDRIGYIEEAIEHYRQSNLSTSAGGGDVKNIYMLATALNGAGENEEAGVLLKQVANWNFNSVWFAMLRKEAAGET